MTSKLKVLIYSTEDQIVNMFKSIPNDDEVDFVFLSNTSEKNVLVEVFQDDILQTEHFTKESVFGLAESLSTTKWSWLDGCAWDGLVKRYKHCGKNCGDAGASGGGTPINAADSCCRAHDRCWGNGLNVPCCDKALLDCLDRVGGAPVVAWGAHVYFDSSAAKCKN